MTFVLRTKLRWSILGAACIAALMLTGCDQNRYELGKDASGNTVRLDRRSGEIAIIKGDQIRTLKDAAQADAEQKTRLAELEKIKEWKPIDSPNTGARFGLSTSWRDGKLYYQFDIYWLEGIEAMQKWAKDPQKAVGEFPRIDPKQRTSGLQKAITYRPFTVELIDGNRFRLASVNIINPIRIVDDQGFTMSYEDKGVVPFAEDDYLRIAGWEVRWVLTK